MAEGPVPADSNRVHAFSKSLCLLFTMCTEWLYNLVLSYDM